MCHSLTNPPVVICSAAGLELIMPREDSFAHRLTFTETPNYPMVFGTPKGTVTYNHGAFLSDLLFALYDVNIVS